MQWNVPRNIHVEPKPINEIVLKKIHYGKKSSSTSKITSYDPRALADRCMNAKALEKLNKRLASCLTSSSYFLFHHIQPKGCTEVEVESLCEVVPECALDLDDQKRLKSEGIRYKFRTFQRDD